MAPLTQFILYSFQLLGFFSFFQRLVTVQRKHSKPPHDTSKHAIHRPRKGQDFGWVGFLPSWALEAVLARLACIYCLYTDMNITQWRAYCIYYQPECGGGGGVLIYIESFLFFSSRIFQLIIQILRTRCWCIVHGTSWPMPLEMRQHIFFLGIRDQLTVYKPYQRYCWWKNSCSSWYGQSPMIYSGFVHPRWLAGFLPPTAW